MTAKAIGWARRNWVTLGLLALVVGSDYKFRTRPATSAITGAVDFFILLELALYGLVALCVLATWRKPGRQLAQAEFLFGAFYLLVMLLSLSRSPYPQFSTARVIEMLILGLFTTAVATRASRADMHRAAHGFLVLVAVSVGYGVVVPSAPISNQQVGRFTWLAIHPTVAGVFVSVASIIAFAYVLTHSRSRPGPRWPLWVYLVLAAVVMTGLVATRTRASVLAGVVGILAVVFLSYHGRRRVELMAGAGLVLTLIALTSTDRIAEYFARGESVEQLQTLNARTDIWSQAFTAIQARPVYGRGVGASLGIFDDGRPGIGTAHNAAVNVAVDLGLLGLAVWLGLIVSILAGLVKLRTARSLLDGVATDRSILIGVFLAVQTNGIFYAGPGAAANVAATWMFLVAGWSLCLRRSESEAFDAYRLGRPAVVRR